MYLHSTWKTPTVNPMHLTAATLSWQSSRCWCMGRMLGQFDPANRNLNVRNGTYGDSCQMLSQPGMPKNFSLSISLMVMEIQLSMEQGTATQGLTIALRR